MSSSSVCMDSNQMNDAVVRLRVMCTWQQQGVQGERFSSRLHSTCVTGVTGASTQHLPQMSFISKAPPLVKPFATHFTTGLCVGHGRDYDLVKTKWGENAKRTWGCSSKNNPANTCCDIIYSDGGEWLRICMRRGHFMLSEPLARSCLNRFSTVTKSVQRKVNIVNWLFAQLVSRVPVWQMVTFIINLNITQLYIWVCVH